MEPLVSMRGVTKFIYGGDGRPLRNTDVKILDGVDFDARPRRGARAGRRKRRRQEHADEDPWRHHPAGPRRNQNCRRDGRPSPTLGTRERMASRSFIRNSTSAPIWTWRTTFSWAANRVGAG